MRGLGGCCWLWAVGAGGGGVCRPGSPDVMPTCIPCAVGARDATTYPYCSYSLFEPEMYCWRLVLMARKLALVGFVSLKTTVGTLHPSPSVALANALDVVIGTGVWWGVGEWPYTRSPPRRCPHVLCSTLLQVAVALLFSSTPLFQAWSVSCMLVLALAHIHTHTHSHTAQPTRPPHCFPLPRAAPFPPPPSPTHPSHLHSLSVGIIFIAYALQVRFRPYADSDMTEGLDLNTLVLGPGMRLVYVRSGRGNPQPGPAPSIPMPPPLPLVPSTPLIEG